MLGGKHDVRHKSHILVKLFNPSIRIIAQLLGPSCDADSPLLGRQQYASFTWSDLWAIAPWLEERITKKIDGPGLGH